MPINLSTRDLAIICAVAAVSTFVLRPAWWVVTAPVRVGLWIAGDRS